MGFLGNLGEAIANTIHNEFGGHSGAPSPQGGTVASFGPANPQAQGSQVPLQRAAIGPVNQAPNNAMTTQGGYAEQVQGAPLGGQGVQGNANAMFHFNVAPPPQLQLHGGMIQGPSPQDDLQPARPLGTAYQAPNNGNNFQGSPAAGAQNAGHSDILTQVRNILGY